MHTPGPDRTLRLLLVSLIGSVVVLRLYLHLVNPNTDLIVLGHEVHHLFTGVVIALPAAFALAFGVTTPRGHDLATFALGLGAGLILDEFVFLIATPGDNAAYVQRTSLVGALACVGAAALVLIVLARRARSRA